MALSSSVVIVNITVSRRRTTDRPTEVALLGWSVLQDLVGVALAAILARARSARATSLAEAPLALGRVRRRRGPVARVLPWVLPRLRDEHDLFLITSVGSGLALAGLGAAVFGVPLALAAFVGGLAVTESHEAAEARRRLRPFRDVFAVLFFVAIGTLVDPSRLGEAAPWLALLLGPRRRRQGRAWRGPSARLARVEVRPLQLAVGLGQIGEFSFVLASAAVAAGAIDGVLFTAIIAAVAVSIAASSIAVRLVPGPEAERRPLDRPPAATGCRPRATGPRSAGRRGSFAAARAAERGSSTAADRPGVPLLAVLRRRDVVPLADRPPALDAVAGVAVDGHQVEGVDARLLVRVAAGDPAARPGAALLELADVPVLAVGQVPEPDRVGRVEAGRRDRRRLEQPLADDPGVAAARPARAGGRAGSPGGSTGTSSATAGSSRSVGRRAR